MSQEMEVLLLSQQDVIAAGALDFEAAIADEEKAYSMLDAGQADEPICPQIWFRGPEVGTAFIAFHPGALAGDVDVAGIKVVGRFPENPRRFGIPSIVAITELMDRDSGKPLALMDGTLITAVRTGVSTAVGAKYLARRDSRVAGLLGAGVMGRTQIMALARVLPHLEDVRIYDIRPEKATAFAQEMSRETGLKIRAVGTPEEAVHDADVVAPTTVVTLDQRYIRAEWIKKGAFLANVSDNDYTFEAVKKADRIVVDGHKQFTIPVVLGEMVKQGMIRVEDTTTIGAIINGKAPGRQREDETIFFSALGMGLHDITIARRVYNRAREMGLGQRWCLWEKPHWT
ncbi:MAG TPA: ornithine cyclodeaminase family protein [Firmicutes bacterium]|nr:ornithine cyclodeaminase family protein [Bacillota bacterium]